MPRATMIFEDVESGEVNVSICYEGEFNDECRAHVLCALLEKQLPKVAARKSEPVMRQLRVKDGLVEEVPVPNNVTLMTDKMNAMHDAAKGPPDAA